MADASVNHKFSYNPNRRLITWERLEIDRLRKLGIANRYSRHFIMLNKSLDSENSWVSQDGSLDSLTDSAPRRLGGKSVLVENGSQNSMAPFATVGKPTCGYYFSRGTDNRKKNFGIPASDLVKWRSQTVAQS